MLVLHTVCPEAKHIQTKRLKKYTFIQTHYTSTKECNKT